MKIRVTTRGLVEYENKVLAVEAYDQETKETFYYLPGGGIEFKEPSEDALVRRLEQEMGVEVTIRKPLLVDEEVFRFNGNEFHQVSFVYEVKLPQHAYLKNEFIIDEGRLKTKGVWLSILDIEHIKLYPSKVKDYLLSKYDMGDVVA